MACYPGMETAYFNAGDQIESRADGLVVCLHWIMVDQGFQCIGTGEEDPSNPMDIFPSELMPMDWNGFPDYYCLRYRPESGNYVGSTFIMKIMVMDTMLVISLHRKADDKIVNNTFDVECYTIHGVGRFDYNLHLDNVEELIIRWKTEMLEGLDGPNAKIAAEEDQKQQPEKRQPRGIRLLAGKGRKKTPNPKGGLTGGLGAILGMGLPGAMPSTESK